LIHAEAKQRLVSAGGGDTLRTRVFDTVRQREWPAPYTGRALRNLFLEQWHDKDAALAENMAEQERYRAAVEAGDFDTALVWAGEVADLIDRIEPASTIVERIGNQAESWLSQAQKLVTESVEETGV